MSQKVFVGLSGGVDSGTSAALLQERGYEVTGVFIKIWQPEFIECTWREDRLDAMRIAAALGIPFREINLSDEYKREVVDSMVRDYAAGITPNPDVICNRVIKFGSFMHWALSEGADMVATGHYARIENGKLMRGVDTGKDQSYFLYQLDKKDLERIFFPIGDLKKSEVRMRAKRFGLPVAEKPDSQGLCFVGDVTMSEFLKRYITVKEGLVVDTSGKVIGTHEGAALYTIGQRHGLHINEYGISRSTHYVTEVDTTSNTVTVSTNREDATRTKVRPSYIHWIENTPSLETEISAQVRYRGEVIHVSLSFKNDEIICTFASPQIASPGQSIVFYDGDHCLGGAIIK